MLEAPAKINLYLEVLGRRPDGFHEVVTVLQTVDLCDELRIALRPRRDDLPPDTPDVVLRLDPSAPVHAHVPAGTDNLAVRACAALLRVAGRAHDTGVDLVLHKRIPVGAGLGGGSSDAAAAVAGLHALLGRPCDGETLHTVCASLGSDVPFFLRGGTALCTGRGECVRPMASPQPFDVLLAFPGFGLATRDVYAALGAAPCRARDDALSRTQAGLVSRLDGAGRAELEGFYRNDLEQPAGRMAPQLAELLTGGWHLSGSGSTLFRYDAASPDPKGGGGGTSIRFRWVQSRNRQGFGIDGVGSDPVPGT